MTESTTTRADLALLNPCPACAADSGEPCNALDGGAAPATPHAVRLETVTSASVLLDADDLACSFCGRVVAGPLPDERVSYTSPDRAEWVPVSGHMEVTSRAALLESEPLTTCPDCEELVARGVDLAHGVFPGGITLGRYRLVGQLAVDAVVSTLVAFAIVGKRSPETRDDLARAAELLSGLGSSATWRSRFAPVLTLDARPGTASPWPWAHVTDEARIELRRAHAGLMAEQVARLLPDLPVAPPSLEPWMLGNGHKYRQPIADGCLMCGVGSLTLTAESVARYGGRDEAARAVWTLHNVPEANLGGSQSRQVVGWVCPTCEDAANFEGTVGPSAVAGAVLSVLGLSAGWSPEDTLVVPAWASLFVEAVRNDEATPAPNARPWAHLDLEDVRARVTEAIQGVRVTMW